MHFSLSHQSYTSLKIFLRGRTNWNVSTIYIYIYAFNISCERDFYSSSRSLSRCFSPMGTVLRHYPPRYTRRISARSTTSSSTFVLLSSANSVLTRVSKAALMRRTASYTFTRARRRGRVVRARNGSV